MIVFLVIVAVVALFMVFCVRHFFVQLISIKLLMDVMIFILSSVRNQEWPSSNMQTVSIIVAALSALVFFVLMAAGIHRFARAKDSGLEVPGD